MKTNENQWKPMKTKSSSPQQHLKNGCWQYTPAFFMSTRCWFKVADEVDPTNQESDGAREPSKKVVRQSALAMSVTMKTKSMQTYHYMF